MAFNFITILWLSWFSSILSNVIHEIKSLIERFLYKSVLLKPYDNGYIAILQFVNKYSLYIDSLQTNQNDIDVNSYVIAPGRYYVRHKNKILTIELRQCAETCDVLKISVFLGKSFDTIFQFIEDAKEEYRKHNKNVTEIYSFDDTRCKWVFKKHTKLPNMSQVVLRDDIKTKVLQLFKTYKLNRKKYDDLMIPYKFGCILEGLHGTGKTTFAKALCSEFQFQKIYNFDPTKPHIWNCVSEINSDSLILIEDIDRHFVASSNQVFDMSQFLNFLDGVNSPQGCVICLTTNNIGVIPNVLLRPGRIQLQLNFTNASFDEIFEYTRMFYKETFDEVMAHNIAKHLDNKITISELQKCFLSHINDLKNACGSLVYV